MNFSIIHNEFGPCHKLSQSCHSETLSGKSHQFFRIEKFQFQPDLGSLKLGEGWVRLYFVGKTYSIDSNWGQLL